MPGEGSEERQEDRYDRSGPSGVASPDALQDLRLLLVEDNPGDVDLVREYIAEAGSRSPLRIERTLGDALAILGEDACDLVLLDLNLPDSTGVETLESVLESGPDVPVLVLTGLNDEELGAAAVRRGAQDFLPKDEMSGPVLRRSIRHAVERHRHEAEVRAAESRAQRYLDVAEVLIVALDREGRITTINPAGAKLLGYESPTSLEGRSWFDLVLPEEDRDRLREVHRALLAGQEELTHFEHPILTRSGAERMIVWKTSLVRDEGGGVTGTLSCGLDITERKASERQLQLLNEALQSAHNAIVITDREGRIEWANPAFTGMTGFTVPEAIGRTFGELLRSGEHDDAFYEAMWGTILGGDVWKGRIFNRRKDGSLYPEEQTITPVRDTSGEIAHFIAVKQDVSESIAAENELRRANRALRVISGGNQALVRSSTEEEILAETCRVAVEVGGYRFAWIGLTERSTSDRIRPVAHRGDGADYLENLDLSLGPGTLPPGPVATAIRTGAPAVVRELAPGEEVGGWEEEALERGYRAKVAIPLMGEETCLGVLSIYSDDPEAFDEREMEVLSELGEDLAYGIEMHRTRRRKAELESQLRQAEKLRAVGQLAGGVAHDFNNYLTVISALTGVVLEDPELSAESREELEEVLGAAERSARLTRQLLAFSRHQVAALRILDLNEAVRDMSSMLDRLLEASIEVEVRLSAHPQPVRVDPGQLEQVVMNLAVNARDAMLDEGAGTLTLETRTDEVRGDEGGALDELEPGRYVVLAVSDTGGGIEEEALPRIFEPFFTEKEQGTGLGLSTVYGIVRQAGGAIRVESEAGRGTRFEIFLPRRNEDEVSDSPGEAAAPEGTEGNETILVVEDQEPVRKAMRRILERSGYDVLETGSVAEAVELVDVPDLSVDLLLTDLGLPDGSGREVAEAFLDVRPHLAVIYTSGYTPGELDLGLELGPREHFIEKPFDLEQLARKVRVALEGGHAPA